MSYQFVEMVKDLAVAQAGPGVDPDPAKADALEARTFRRRLAGLAWIPGTFGVVYLAGWANSVIVGIAGFVLLLAGLWVFAERGDQLAPFIRRSRATP